MSETQIFILGLVIVGITAKLIIGRIAYRKAYNAEPVNMSCIEDNSDLGLHKIIDRTEYAFYGSEDCCIYLDARLELKTRGLWTGW